MDLLKDAAKNLNLYEVKAYVRKAQNGMLFETFSIIFYSIKLLTSS